MRTLLFVFLAVLLLATTASAQTRVEFGGLSAWELTYGVRVQTECEVTLLDAVMDEVYCFSNAAAKAQFARDIESNILKATAAYEKERRTTELASSPSLAASPLALPLQGNSLYVNSFFRSGASSTLYRINQANAAATTVGAMGKRVTDVAFKGATLFGVTFNQLLKVNATTGASTVVGTFGSGMTDINALVVSPSGSLLAAGGNDGKFISINPTTGKGTKLGDYGTFFKNGQNREIISSGDLAFRNGVLFATVRLKGLGSTNDYLATVKQTTPNRGKATLLNANGNGIGFKDVWGLSIRNGVLFAVTEGGRLLTINPSTGVGKTVGAANGVKQGGMTTSP